MEDKRILVIDDDMCFLEVIQYFLEMEKYRVTGITQAEDIIPLVESTKPDLVLLDYLLPSSNGANMCRKLHECPDLKGLPLVLTSAYPHQQLPLDNVSYSIFIPKPFDLWYLLACIKKLLGRRFDTAT